MSLRHLSIFLLLPLLVLLAGCGDNGNGEGPLSTCWKDVWRENTWKKYTIWGSSPTDIFAAGIYMEHFDGYEWDSTGMHTYWHLNDMWGTSGTDVFGVGGMGVIQRYNGSRWSKMWTGFYNSGYHFTGVWGNTNTDVFAVGRWRESNEQIWSLIMHYDGSDWIEMEQNFSIFLQGVWGSSSQDVFAVGFEGEEDSATGAILRYDGNEWSVVLDRLPYALYGVGGSAADNVFAVGQYGVVMHFNGLEWVELYGGRHHIPHTFLDVWVNSDTEIYFSGDSGAIHYFDGDILHDWSREAGGNLEGVWASSPSNVYVTGWEKVDTFKSEGFVLKYTCE